MATKLAADRLGIVFTKRWVVEMILDLAGYVETLDLASMIAVEPSCGHGSFLGPMVERLSTSCKNHGRSILDAKNALLAFDTEHDHTDVAKRLIRSTLIKDGWPARDIENVSMSWVRKADYLLANHQERAVDFVIGNPPYIRSSDIRRKSRAEYVKRHETMTAGTDIYVGFFEVGLETLRNDGTLAFICADRWMRNTYGKRLRKFISAGYAVETVLEMHDVDAFDDRVAAYPAVAIIRAQAQAAVAAIQAKADFDACSANQLVHWITSDNSKQFQLPSVEAARLPKWFSGDSFWPRGSPDKLKVLDKLEKEFDFLEDPATGTKVGIGVATGAEQVFMIEEETLVESVRLLPLVTTTHIRSGTLKWENMWLANPWNGNGALVDLQKYPKLKRYLESSSGHLKKRHTARKSPSDWYRTIDKIDGDLIKKKKLLFQDMKASIQPVLDLGHFYPHHNLYWVVSDKWDLEVLGGLLLSKVAQMFVECYSTRVRGGTLRFQSQYLRQIRVPDQDNLSKELKQNLAQAFRDRNVELATKSALEAYKLTEVPD